jgi:MFS family permease
MLHNYLPPLGTIAFMLCGANSDLFGRRTFILFGNVLMLVGAVLGGTSHSTTQTIAAHAILGFGGGNCQIAAFALPELLPNKWRHVGVVIADAGIYFDVIAGPVVSRIALRNNAVRFIAVHCHAHTK